MNAGYEVEDIKVNLATSDTSQCKPNGRSLFILN